MQWVAVHIQKPLYGSFVYVRDKYIKEAQNKGLPLRISCPGSICLVSPEEWLKDAKRIEKVYLQPNNPMILFGNDIEKFK